MNNLDALVTVNCMECGDSFATVADSMGHEHMNPNLYTDADTGEIINPDALPTLDHPNTFVDPNTGEIIVPTDYPPLAEVARTEDRIRMIMNLAPDQKITQEIIARAREIIRTGDYGSGILPGILAQREAALAEGV
jgi:hypothetical protein